jgi:hypothetical protein
MRWVKLPVHSVPMTSWAESSLVSASVNKRPYPQPGLQRAWLFFPYLNFSFLPGPPMCEPCLFGCAPIHKFVK